MRMFAVMSDEEDRKLADRKQIQAWLDGWGQYVWGTIALLAALFLLWNMISGLFS